MLHRFEHVRLCVFLYLRMCSSVRNKSVAVASATWTPAWACNGSSYTSQQKPHTVTLKTVELWCYRCGAALQRTAIVTISASADISVLQSAAAPAPQATSPPAASSAPAAMALGATAAAPGGDAGQPAHPSWATNTHQAADVQAPPTGVPAGPQPAGHVHGAWYGQYPQAPSELPAHQRQPLGTNGERPGQPPAAQPHPGQPVTMPHHSHLPPGVQPQGFSPQGYYHQGYVPQYPPHGHFHTGVPQSAQWPQAQSIAAGNPMGGHIPGCGWYPNMSNVQSPNGAQPRPHGTHGWGAHPGGHPIPAPGGADRSHMWQPLQHNANMMQTHHGWSAHPRGHPVPAPAGGDRSQPWNPLAHNANSMQPQQPSGYNMSMVNPQGQYHGGSGPQGNAASPGHDTGTRTTDDMFRGMQIRQ